MPKILAVDDKKDNLTALSALLNALIPGCSVITAQSGAEGLEKAKTESPDTILLDIKMPEMDGYEVCNRLKDDETTKHIPVIMISAIKTESEDLVKGLETGADAYLSKPIDEYVLIAQVKTALRIKKAEDHLRGQKNLLESTVQERTAELLRTNEQLKHEINNRINAEKQYRMLIETMNDGLFLMDENFLITFANKRLFEILGYPKDKIIGTSMYHFLDVSNQRIFDKQMELHKKDSHAVYELTFIRKDGQKIPVIVSPSAIIDADGQFKGSLGVITDISKIKQLEAQLAQAQKMEAIGTLAGGIAHDFNNILTTIIGNAELALMDVIKDESLRKEIEEIKKAGKRAASLTHQLLAFSRKQMIKPEILDINELLTDIEKMLGRLIGENIELLTIPEPELWQVEIDPGQMEQVIMNLAVNARDAMPKGGKLTIETANADLNKNYFREHGIKEEKPGHYVMLTVSDTGSGMDKETRGHIFEPFFTTKEVGKGTGLGLSTVYGIVKQNNGFVWVYSEPEQGSNFKVYLPKVKGDAEPKEKEQSPVEDLGGSETVLIVEDNDSLRNFAQKILHIYGYRTLNAENGEDALRVCKEHDGQIDLMITDVVMPKMGGREAAERLQPLYPQMKVIYMSGYTDDAIVHHGVLEPGLNFLEKPFTPEGLGKKVRKALGSEK
jgi:PAS domain S-box-containing protein